MCGISGVIGDFSKQTGDSIVTRMNDTIVHRGPDDEGLWSVQGFAFGMRRLSIIDLEGGHQPIHTDDGVGVVFNGEIYNYKTLRKELVDRGYRFKTHSDTEVLINLFHSEGIEGLQRLEGMFAICLYDPRSGRVHLLRDRLGIKPLYYTRHQGRFFFASEIKAILAGMENRPDLDLQSLHHYLTFRYVPAPATIWKNIFKLEPGHQLLYRLHEGDFTLKKYLEVVFHSEPVDPERDYPSEFETLFLNAVEKRLVASDVPVGVMLSGGLDSSAISAAAVELGHQEFHTFSVGFDQGGAFSELNYAQKMAQHIGSRHHEVVIGQRKFLDFLPEFVRYTDEPLADLASIPLYYLSQLAQNYVKVVLSGEGSDEILAGYDMEIWASRLDRLHAMTGFLPLPLLRLLCACMPMQRSFFFAVGKNGWSGYLKARGAHMTDVFSKDKKKLLWGKIKNFQESDTLIRSWYDLSSSRHPIDQLQQVYCHSWLVDDLLMKADKMSMACSLELRVPFLDHKLVEWAAKLPMAWKTGTQSTGYVSKRILRQFAQQRLPQEIIQRPKQGFPVPAYHWLRGELGGWAKNHLLEKGSRLGALFDPAPITPLLAMATAGDDKAAHQIWNLIILEQWLRQWT